MSIIPGLGQIESLIRRLLSPITNLLTAQEGKVQELLSYWKKFSGQLASANWDGVPAYIKDGGTITPTNMGALNKIINLLEEKVIPSFSKLDDKMGTLQPILERVEEELKKLDISNLATKENVKDLIQILEKMTNLIIGHRELNQKELKQVESNILEAITKISANIDLKPITDLLNTMQKANSECCSKTHELLSKVIMEQTRPRPIIPPNPTPSGGSGTNTPDYSNLEPPYRPWFSDNPKTPSTPSTPNTPSSSTQGNTPTPVINPTNITQKSRFSYE